MEKEIIYLGKSAVAICDEKCDKAWGINKRPRIYPQLNNHKIYGIDGTDIYPEEYYLDDNFQVDDCAYASDNELGKAPIDTGIIVDSDKKPTRKSQIPNKWCIRECERCVIGDKPELKDFSKRYYNIYPHTRD